jgi:UDP-N-acetylglucosamine transferase subunit ALG13
VGKHENVLSKRDLRGGDLLILVALGTHELPFTRLLYAIEDLVKQRVITEPVVIQNGHTPFTSDVMTCKPFVSFEEMKALYKEASLIVTHAGTGSVVMGCKENKKVIVAARLKKYGEHNDDHQLQLVEEFEKANYILPWHDGGSLKEVICKSKTFQPAPFVSGKKDILFLLQTFIETGKIEKKEKGGKIG